MIRRNPLSPLFPSLMVAVLLLSGCRADTDGPPPDAASEARPVAVKAVPAQVGSLSGHLTYPGNVAARAQVVLVSEVPGRVLRLHVALGSEVRAGDLVAEVDSATYELQLAQARAGGAAARAKLAAVESGSRREQVGLAEANLRTARSRLEGMKDGGRAEMIAQAEANLRAAEARLARAKKGATPEQLAQAEAQWRLARNNEYYQQQYADALGRALSSMSDEVDVGALRHAQLGVAYEQTKIAEAQLAQVRAGATEEEIIQAEAAVEVARQQVEMARRPFTQHEVVQAEAAVRAAEQQLALAVAPFTAEELNAARAALDQAQASVDLAELQLKKTRIIAPIDAVVAQRMVHEGAMLGAGSPVAALVSRDTEVVVNVDEARIGQLQLGQAATITVSAYPGRRFPGEVAAIAPAVEARGRTVAVKVRPRAGEGLMDGMFAQVSIVTDERAEALLVPSSAVTQLDGRAFVYLVEGGKAWEREVRVGLAAGGRVEIIEGLTSGDLVVADDLGLVADGRPVAPILR